MNCKMSVFYGNAYELRSLNGFYRVDMSQLVKDTAVLKSAVTVSDPDFDSALINETEELVWFVVNQLNKAMDNQALAIIQFCPVGALCHQYRCSSLRRAFRVIQQVVARSRGRFWHTTEKQKGSDSFFIFFHEPW